MPYIKTVLVIAVIVLAVIAGVNNTQAYTLSFLHWDLRWAVPLWALLLAAFLAGMLPIIIVNLPAKLTGIKDLHGLRRECRRRERELKTVRKGAARS